jgi:hypothetical protein
MAPIWVSSSANTSDSALCEQILHRRASPLRPASDLHRQLARLVDGHAAVRACTVSLIALRRKAVTCHMYADTQLPWFKVFEDLLKFTENDREAMTKFMKLD